MRLGDAAASPNRASGYAHESSSRCARQPGSSQREVSRQPGPTARRSAKAHTNDASGYHGHRWARAPGECITIGMEKALSDVRVTRLVFKSARFPGRSSKSRAPPASRARSSGRFGLAKGFHRGLLTCIDYGFSKVAITLVKPAAPGGRVQREGWRRKLASR